jgi:hypothetical protein
MMGCFGIPSSFFKIKKRERKREKEKEFSPFLPSLTPLSIGYPGRVEGI